MNILFTYGFIYGNPQVINYPVWNALLIHLNFLKKTNQVYILLRNESLYNELKNHYNYTDLDYIVFKNRAKLVQELKNKKIDLIFSPDIISTVKLSYLKFRYNYKILTWYQGAFPEESYLKNKSFFRKKILDYFEKFSLKLSDKNVFVSESMRCHFQSKHNYHKNNFIVIPCFSDFTMVNHNKINDSFVYIGSLSKWQCFDKIVDLIGTIKKIKPNAVFDIITLNITEANSVVKQKLGDLNQDIKIYSISDRTKIPEILSKFQYGFLIRENSIINKVSSPIKFAEYLSCGVNIIMTDSISHFAQIVNNYRVGTVIPYSDINNQITHINEFKDSVFCYQEEFKIDQVEINYQKFVSEK